MKFGRVLLIGFVLMLSSGLTAAQSLNEPRPVTNPASMPIVLDIPPQSLETALKAFSDTTRVALFYESNVISGRRSSALRGTYPPEVALRMLLQGTGLSSTSFERGTITILPPRADEASEIKRAKDGVLEFSPYLALVQKSLDLAFCDGVVHGSVLESVHGAVIESDPDEMLARLWVAPSGAVLRVELLSSTGSDQRDRIYQAMLSALVIEARPPAAMPQPINLMIIPKKSRQSAICNASGTASRSALQ